MYIWAFQLKKKKFIITDIWFLLLLFFWFAILLFQPDCLDDLAYAIMYETTKLCYRVSEADVTRARNQVATNAFILCWYKRCMCAYVCIYIYILSKLF